MEKQTNKTQASSGSPLTFLLLKESSSGDSYPMGRNSLRASTWKSPNKNKPSKRVRTKDITAFVIADLLVNFCSQYGDLLTNLKLQKLLYYAQSWHLAIYETELFPEKFQAWAFGPIQPETYAKYLEHGTRPIEQETALWQVPKKVSKHISDVMEAYGGFSAYELERLSCGEEPWQEAREGLEHDEPSAAIIDTATMKLFYKRKADGKR